MNKSDVSLFSGDTGDMSGKDITQYETGNMLLTCLQEVCLLQTHYFILLPSCGHLNGACTSCKLRSCFYDSQEIIAQGCIFMGLGSE